MAKYKVYYSGFTYVEADSIEDAEENYEYDCAYAEKQVEKVEEVDAFTIFFWEDDGRNSRQNSTKLIKQRGGLKTWDIMTEYNCSYFQYVSAERCLGMLMLVSTSATVKAAIDIVR